jgi:PEP-CTERM motif
MFDFGRKHIAAGLVAGAAVAGAGSSQAAVFTEPVSSADVNASMSTSLVAQVPVTLAHTYFGATSFSIDATEGSGWEIRNLSNSGTESASAQVQVVASLNGSNSTVLYSQTFSFAPPGNQAFASGPQGTLFSFPSIDFNRLNFILTLDPSSGPDTLGIDQIPAIAGSHFTITAGSTVPEPASICLVGLASAGVLRRRRRCSR